MTFRECFETFWFVLVILMITFAFAVVCGANIDEESKAKDCTNLGAFRIGDVVYVCEKKK